MYFIVFKIFFNFKSLLLPFNTYSAYNLSKMKIIVPYQWLNNTIAVNRIRILIYNVCSEVFEVKIKKCKMLNRYFALLLYVLFFDFKPLFLSNSLLINESLITGKNKTILSKTSINNAILLHNMCILKTIPV